MKKEGAGYLNRDILIQRGKSEQAPRSLSSGRSCIQSHAKRREQKRGISKFMEATHHTPYTQRLNISNVSQSTKSLQGSFSLNLSGGLSILQSPLQRKIPRFVFPGPGFPKRLNHFQGSSKANNKELKPRSSSEVSCLHSPAEPPGVRLHSVCLGAAARRLQSWGVRANEEMHPKKCSSVYRRASE